MAKVQRRLRRVIKILIGDPERMVRWNVTGRRLAILGLSLLQSLLRTFHTGFSSSLEKVPLGVLDPAASM